MNDTDTPSKRFQFSEQRHAEVLSILRKDGFVEVSSLVRQFGLSTATIRRDLLEMENNGLLLRTHGGAIPLGAMPAAVDAPLRARQQTGLAEKQRIGAAAAALVQDGYSIFIDAGTTAAAVAAALPANKSLKIVTNAVNLHEFLHQDLVANLTLTGGRLRQENLSMVGSQACEAVSMYTFDIAFLGTAAIDTVRGMVSTPSELEAAFQRAVIPCAGRIVVVATASKFESKAFAKVTGLDQIDAIVTDAQPSDSQTEALAIAAVRLIVAT